MAAAAWVAAGATALAAGGALFYAAGRTAAPAPAPPPALPAQPPQPPTLPARPAPTPAQPPAPTKPQAAVEVRPPAAPAPIPPIPWLGGSSAANREALGFMLASENPSASRLAWFLQCLVINNKARRRRGLGVRSLADALRSGVKDSDPKRRLVLGLEYGPQYDETSGMVRIASTSAARKKGAVSKDMTAFVESLLGGTLDPRGLVGLRGEACPAPSVWPLLTDWLQFRNFEKTVRAQLGSSKKRPKTAAEVVAQWGSPRLYLELDGLRFYGERPRGEA